MKRSTFTTREGHAVGSSPRAYRDAMAHSVWDRASQPLKPGEPKCGIQGRSVRGG